MMKNILLLRSYLGISQRDFAKTIGVSTTTLSQWENNIRSPQVSKLREITNKYQVPLEWLMTTQPFSITINGG